MKINQPVTDREVMMKPGTLLVTRTNLKGIITFANDAFIEISGFAKDELIGSNHNMVRHPDMPPEVFEDLWLSLKAGKPWTGQIKNRTKSGDYYWVEANVTPVYKNAQLHEYLSVRYAPTREQVAEAEAHYEMINAKKATMKASGFTVAVKKIMDMGLWQKAMVVYALFLLPLLASLYSHYLQQQWLALAVCSALVLLGSLLGYLLMRSIVHNLETSLKICYRMANDQFRNKIDLERGGIVGDFNRALYGMQVKLNADLAYAKQVAAETTRIKQALDNVQSCVMVANNELNIIYLNKAVVEMFENAEADIRTQLPNFAANSLLGANIDQFHRNPAHQRSLLADLNSTLKSELIIGGRHMNLVANPVRNDDGERIGVVVECLDRTNEVTVEQEIQEIVNSVKIGQLDKRLSLADKYGFFAKLSEGINELTDVIERVIKDIGSSMESISDGDLTNRITSDYQGVYLTCKQDVNASIDRLSEIFTQVNASARFINNSSQEIASGNNNLSQRAEQQAANLEQTAASMEQLTYTVKINSENAQKANLVASNARELAENGGDVVTAAVAAMQEINQSSNRIADIIGVIDEIAFQTNLLALNASVEAARAGEQGRGFSVVATEVRNLAQRSATAARESKELIQNSVQKVRAGSEFVNQTGTALHEIVTSVKKVGDIVAAIAGASIEQSAGIAQVNQAVGQMDEITQQNAALAEQASAASISMSELSTNMVELMSFFKLGNEASNIVIESNRPALETGKNSPAAGLATYKSTSSDEEWLDF